MLRKILFASFVLACVATILAAGCDALTSAFSKPNPAYCVADTDCHDADSSHCNPIIHTCTNMVPDGGFQVPDMAVKLCTSSKLDCQNLSAPVCRGGACV